MRNSYQKFVIILLVLSMIFSLGACGSSSSPLTSESSDDSGKKQEDAPKHPEFIYTSTYSDLDINTNEYISILYFTDDGFYCTYEEVVGEEIPEGVIPEYEGQYYIREPRLMFVTYNGEIRKIEGYHSLPRPEGSEEQYGYSSSVYLNSLTENSSGNLVAVECISESWNTIQDLSTDTPEYWDNYVYSMSYYLRELNPDGSEISKCLIELGEGDEMYLSSTVILDDNGNFITANGNNVRVIDAKGNTIYTADAGSYIDSVAQTPDGSIYVSTYTESGFNALRKLNTESKTFGEEIPIPYDAYSFYAGGGDYPLYYTSGQNFYGLNPETGEATKIFDWISLDINPDNLGYIGILSDGKVVGINTIYVQETEGFTFEKFIIEKTPYEAVPQKTVLKLATLSLGYSTKNAIVKFNRLNPDFRIEVTDYSEFNTEEDYSAGLTKLTTELMAGNCPDILELTGLPVSQLEAKGILEDLYQFIDSDPELNRDDYFANVLASQEQNGKLVSTVSGFAVNAVVGATSVVGDKIGWTYSEFSDVLAEFRDSVPEAEPFDPYITRDSMLNTCLGLDMGQYVDWNTGKCNFDSEGFVDLLKFVNTFPAEYDWDNEDYYDLGSLEERTSSGLQMLATTSIYSFDDVFFLNGYFGGKELTFIGYPTCDGTPGNTIFVESGLAMVSKSTNKEAVWKFLRTFFTEDYQKNNYYLPSSKALFDKKLQEAMTVKYQKNSSGDYQLDTNGEKIPVARMGIYNDKGELEYFYAVSQEQADKIVTIVNSTTKVHNNNDSILEIVSEQAAAFFSGQKSAEEVAKLIQSKANIYVNEQR